jgi:hypothetical protein
MWTRFGRRSIDDPKLPGTTGFADDDCAHGHPFDRSGHAA